MTRKTTNPEILKMRKQLEQNLANKRKSLEDSRARAAELESQVKEMEEALALMPDSVATRESQTPAGEESVTS